MTAEADQVIEAARRLVAHWARPRPHTAAVGYDEAEHRARAMLTHAVHNLDAITPHPGSFCTGVAARWCPTHGACTCPTGDYQDLNDPACPLHSPRSTHPNLLVTP